MLCNGDMTNVGMKEHNVILKPQVRIQLLACLHKRQTREADKST